VHYALPGVQPPTWPQLQVADAALDVLPLGVIQVTIHHLHTVIGEPGYCVSHSLLGKCFRLPKIAGSLAHALQKP
jgi:hypothetical protein